MIDGLGDNSYCSGLDEEKIYYIMCSDLWANNATFTIYP